MPADGKSTGLLTTHDRIVLLHHRADPLEADWRFDNLDAHLTRDGIDTSTGCNGADDGAAAHPLCPVPCRQLEHIITGDVRSGFIDHPKAVRISIHGETNLCPSAADKGPKLAEIGCIGFWEASAKQWVPLVVDGVNLDASLFEQRGEVATPCGVQRVNTDGQICIADGIKVDQLSNMRKVGRLRVDLGWCWTTGFNKVRVFLKLCNTADNGVCVSWERWMEVVRDELDTVVLRRVMGCG